MAGHGRAERAGPRVDCTGGPQGAAARALEALVRDIALLCPACDRFTCTYFLVHSY